MNKNSLYKNILILTNIMFAKQLFNYKNEKIITNTELLIAKTELISYIYSVLDLSKYKYRLLEHEQDLELIKKTRYFISPNYNGIQSLLIFKEIDNIKHCYILDKTKLAFSKNKVDINKVSIFKISLPIDNPDLYKGTIIDGVYLNNDSKFIINDIHYFRGKNLQSDKIKYKLINITKFLELYPKASSSLIINKLYDPHDISKLVGTYIPTSKLSNYIKGLAFYPEISNNLKLIYLFNNCSKNVEKEHVNTAFSIPSNTPPTKIKDGQLANIRMKKTGITDVYNLTLSSSIVKDNKKYIMFKQIGIAYIPNIECSIMCNSVFEHGRDTVIMECKYVEENDKWIPLKRSTNPKPDPYDTFY